MVVLATGVGDALSDDARFMVILLGPALAAITVTLTLGRPELPSWVLWSGPWSDRPAAPRLLKPCLPGVLTAIAVAASAYVGAGWSLLRAAAQGPRLQPSAASSSPDWSLPLIGAGVGVLAGCLFVMVVMLPAGAALNARREWNTDRPEALRLLTFTGSCLGFWTAVVGVIVADPTPAQMSTDAESGSLARRSADLQLLVNVLVGGSPQAPVWAAGAWIARTGIVLLLASLITYWLPRWKPTGKKAD